MTPNPRWAGRAGSRRGPRKTGRRRGARKGGEQCSEKQHGEAKGLGKVWKYEKFPNCAVPVTGT